MANGEISTGSHDTVPGGPNSRATAQLGEATFLLKAWALTEQSDSVWGQQLREAEYAHACDILKRVYADVSKIGKALSLTMPYEGEAVSSHDLTKNIYDLTEVSYGGEVEPGQSVALKTYESLMNSEQQVTNVYFGDYRQYFEVADIARVLGAGGTLSLIDESQVYL